jgi:hypothetical protein
MKQTQLQTVATWIMRALIRKSSQGLQEVLDVMLRAPTADATTCAVRQPQLDADMSKNLDALRSLVQIKQPRQSYDVSWLELAVDSNMPGLFGLLLRNRSYPGLSAHSALQTAIEKGYTAIVAMLVEQGVEVAEDQRQALTSITHLEQGEYLG